jgi:ribosomal protein L11 methyltransferase
MHCVHCAIIRGAEAESASYFFVQQGAFGAVEREAQLYEVYYDPLRTSTPLETLSESFQCFIESVEEIDASFDYVTAANATWYPIAADGIRIIPVLSEDVEHDASKDILIRPGSGFGTGHHPTTRMLISTLSDFIRRTPSSRTMWDIGTGSGILALIYRKLTRGSVKAWEYDVLAVENARENFRLNNEDIVLIEEPFSIELPSPSTEELPDIIVANLYSSLHIDFCKVYHRCLPSSGILMISGILHTQWSELQDYFPAELWKPIAISRLGDWMAASLMRH